MSDPESDSVFHERLLRVVAAADREAVLKAKGKRLDVLGRTYDVVRIEVSRQGFDGFEGE